MTEVCCKLFPPHLSSMVPLCQRLTLHFSGQGEKISAPCELNGLVGTDKPIIEEKRILMTAKLYLCLRKMPAITVDLSDKGSLLCLKSI